VVLKERFPTNNFWLILFYCIGAKSAQARLFPLFGFQIFTEAKFT